MNQLSDRLNSLSPFGDIGYVTKNVVNLKHKVLMLLI